jgi:hypothetical protein
MSSMDDEENYFTESMLAQVLAALEHEGLIDVVGMSEDGEEVYQLTEKGFEFYMTQAISFDQWLRIGYESGFCSPPVCYSHDGMPMTAGELEELDEGYEPCMHLLRVYEDPAMKKGVEAHHPASTWRATNLGWTD